jgi:predicted dehydrogenase
MHLHYLRELEERFEVTALCDVSQAARDSAAQRFFPNALRIADWQDVLDQRLDAVMILTSGSHGPIATAAATKGLHLFVEKPLALSSAEAFEVADRAERAGVRLMMGYMKRYDPAYERFAAYVRSIDDLRLVRVTTLESAIEPYVAHYPLALAGDVPSELRRGFEADDRERVATAIGEAGEDPTVYRAFRVVLLDCMVHELNALRGLLGEPTEVRYVGISGAAETLTAVIRFGEIDCVVTWADVPDLTRYRQEISFIGSSQRASLIFQSPFLRNVPTEIVREGGPAREESSWRTSEVISYQAPFKRELMDFYDCVVHEREPRTTGGDGARDIALCEALIRTATELAPQVRPTDLEGPHVVARP